MKYFSKTIAIFFVLITFSPAAFAASLNVPAQYPTIQAGINAAAVGDTVLLDPGMYTGDGNRDLDFLGKDITVRSRDNNRATCTIACQGSYSYPHRGFIFQSGESSLARVEGITVYGGYANSNELMNSDSGGAILCINESSPTIINCRLSNCIAESDGGGIASITSTPTLIDCWIDANLCGNQGGGVSAVYSGSLTMNGCLVTGNNSNWGAGIYNNCLATTIYECTIADNVGAGIYSMEPFTVLYSTIIGNSIGITAHGGIVIENSLIANNEVSFFEVFTYQTLTCCNIFGNYFGDWTDLIADQLGTNGNISADPMLCDPDNWDYHIAPDSPCLNDLCSQIGAFGAGDCGTPPSPAGDEIQLSSGLRGNYPNPFNPSTTIRYELEQDSPVMLQIYDVTGKLIRTLENGDTRTAGMHEAFWNGRDNAGHGVAAGVFLYVLTTSEGRDTGRMALIK